MGKKKSKNQIAKEFIDKVNESLKAEIEEHLDSEPVTNPNPISNNPQMVQYTGKNAGQIMEFCDSYHMAIETGGVKFYVMNTNVINMNSLAINHPAYQAAQDCIDKHNRAFQILFMKIGQSMIKDGYTFKVVD